VRVRSGLGQLAAHLVLVAFSAAVLLPLLWVLASSLAGGSGRGEPDLGGYVEILTARPFATWFLNSLAVGLGSTAVALPPAAMLAYAFARLGTGGERLRLAVLAGQALPPIALALPLFAIFLGARLLDTRAALIVAHVALNLPFLTWMLIASFEGDAKQLEETARVEGASRPRAFLNAALPAAARHPGGGAARVRAVLERAPAGAGPLGRGRGHAAGRARLARGAPGGGGGAARGGAGVGLAAGRGPPAAPAPPPRQGAVAGAVR
jgi:multiple sugar transport system permease protein